MNPTAWIAIAIVGLAGAACGTAEHRDPTSDRGAAEATTAGEAVATEAAGSPAVRAAIATARADLEAGRGTAALATLDQLVHDYPESARAWLALAQAHDDPDLPVDLRDTETAVRAARQALAHTSDPPNATYLITLGTALLLDGQTDQAIETYERALRGEVENRQELQQLVLRLKLR